MTYVIEVENIKCGGCASSIVRALEALPGVEAVEVDIEAGRVTVAAPEETRPDVTARLAELGYPERGSVEGLKAATARARSFVSCAVGRLNQED